MYNELLAVVDENDIIINCLPRHEIHARKLCHRAVHILVFNDQKQLFLQQRSMNKDLNKGLWDTSAAGHVDFGEHYQDCAKREVREELGVEIVNSLKKLFKLSPTPQLGMEFIEVYQCLHNGPFSLAEDEIDQGKWLSREMVSLRVAGDDPTLTDTFKIIWQQYQQTDL